MEQLTGAIRGCRIVFRLRDEMQAAEGPDASLEFGEKVGPVAAERSGGGLVSLF
jgi:hypothetical protein